MNLQNEIQLEYELIQTKNIVYKDSISYAEQLELTEWKALRANLIYSSNCCCSICKAKETYNEYNVTQKTVKNYFIEIVLVIDEFGLEQREEIVFTPTNKTVILQIHHQYYIAKRMPWQYHNECFKVVCVDCHKKIHQEQKIKKYAIINGKIIEQEMLKPCIRCNGVGILPEYHYIKEGICFRCNGKRFEEYIKPKK